MTASVPILDTEDNDDHAYLVGRGFTPATIRDVGWRVARLSTEDLRRYSLPGDAAGIRGWFIPYRHPNGQVAFERLRLLDDEDVERFRKYRQPTGRQIGLYDPFGVLYAEGPPPEAVLLIEGEANAVAACVAMPGLPVIGVPGQGSLKPEMAFELGHIQTVWLWIDRHDPDADANAGRIAERLRDAGVEEVRQLGDTAGMDANEALGAFGAEKFAAMLRKYLDDASPIASVADAAGDWPRLLTRPMLPGFPLAALPDQLAEFAQAVAEETQTPVDLAAIDMLGVLSAAAMGATVVDCGAWNEETNLYLLVAMSSGEHKSAVLRSIIAPLREIERELMLEGASEVRDARLRLEQLEAKRSQLNKRIGQEDDADVEDTLRELSKVVDQVEQIGDPHVPRLLADDATPEALAGLVARHGSIAILAAEAPIIDNIVGGRYDAKGSANLTLMCRGYTGEEMKVDRRGREPERLERPLITTLLTIQPYVLRNFVQNETARNQGLVGRFAYAMPESRLGSRAITGIGRASEELRRAWEDTVRHVYSCRQLTQPTQPMPDPGCVGCVSCQQKAVFILSLSPSAKSMLDALRASREPRLADDGDLRPDSDWIERDAGRAARIAALLHLAEKHNPAAAIDDDTMRRALLIADYFAEHSLAALRTPDEKVRRALKVLGRRDSLIVSQRDLHRDVLNGRGIAQEAGELAQTLVKLGVLRPRAVETPSTKGGPRPSQAYDVNPRVRDGGSR